MVPSKLRSYTIRVTSLKLIRTRYLLTRVLTIFDKNWASQTGIGEKNGFLSHTLKRHLSSFSAVLCSFGFKVCKKSLCKAKQNSFNYQYGYQTRRNSMLISNPLTKCEKYHPNKFIGSKLWLTVLTVLKSKTSLLLKFFLITFLNAFFAIFLTNSKSACINFCVLRYTSRVLHNKNFAHIKTYCKFWSQTRLKRLKQ